MKTSLCTSFCGHVFIFLAQIPKEELLGGKVDVEFHMKLLKVFPHWLSLSICQSPHILTSILVLSVFFSVDSNGSPNHHE